MRGGEAPEDGEEGGRLPVGAIVAGLAALCAAALGLGMFDGAPPGGRNGLGAFAAGPAPRDPALPPGPRLRFHGPGGELVEPPAARRP